MLPDSPPIWLRLLAAASAFVGCLFGAAGLPLSTKAYTEELIVIRKYISKSGDEFVIRAEAPGLSHEAVYHKAFFNSALRGDTLTLRSNGLHTLSRNGRVISWEIDDGVGFSLLFTLSAFVPFLLLLRYRNAWVRAICYGAGGLGSGFIMIFGIWAFIRPIG